MTDFMLFKNAVNTRITEMVETGLYTVEVDKDKLWDTYLESFPPGTNLIYKTNTEHDCQCCKHFIKTAGSIVTIVNNELVSIWDITIDNHFQVIADALSNLVKRNSIKNNFLHFEKNLGTNFNLQMLEDNKVITWEHLHYELPKEYIKRKENIGNILGNHKGNKDVFKRSMEELTLDSAEIVLDLIKQHSLYRGDEYEPTIKNFITYKLKYDEIPIKNKDNYCWLISNKLGVHSRIKNTVIGTLLEDISKGIELDRAVTSFETKVAPSNYKRSSAIVSKRMIQDAQNKVEDLEISDALYRRHAITEDLTINNVIYADRTSKKAMNAFDEMIEAVPTKIKNLDKIEEVSIDTFIKDIVPTASTIELLVKNSHNPNLMSLIAPIHIGAKPILKWNNNFSWTYNGEVTDSMKQHVKKAGGNITGKLRFSIQWNENNDNPNDFDAHCLEPNGNLISFNKKKSSTSGTLDVDIINPKNKIAVENITWEQVPDGIYKFFVHNYTHRGGSSGFRAEIEYKEDITSFDYPKFIGHTKKIQVAEINILNEKLQFINKLPSTTSSQNTWGINTETFNKVNLIMHSPNHWDNQKIGNKHVFFILDNCINPDKSRGFYNEFLKDELHEHRKVFEILGSKMKIEPSNNQLSGLGFSLTQRNSIVCKITGSFSRMIKINF